MVAAVVTDAAGGLAILGLGLPVAVGAVRMLVG